MQDFQINPMEDPKVHKISFYTSELLEYASLMARMAFDHDLSLKRPLDPELIAIKDATNEHMTSLLGMEVQFFVKTLLVQQMAQYSATVLKVETVSAWFEDLKAMEDEALLDLYLESLIERNARDDLEDIILDTREDDFLVAIDFDEEAFKEFVTNFGLYRSRLLLFLDQFYQKIFLPNKASIMDKAALEKRKLVGLYNEDMRKFMKTIIRPNSERFLSDPAYKADFYVSVAYPNNVGYMMRKNHPEQLYIIFGVYVLEIFKANLSEEAMKLMGEATKMSILKILAKGPAYASEVAKTLNLNRATISHHLNQLVSVGAINIAYQTGNKSYYELDLNQIRESMDDFLKMLANQKEA